MKPLTCSSCGEEVRHGTRGDFTGWLHRGDVDHNPLFGFVAPAEEVARWDAEFDVVRTREKVSKDGVVTIETYTVRDLDLERYRKSKKFREAEERDSNMLESEDDEPDAIPEPEVRQHPVEIDSFPPRSGIRQILNLITKTDGWEVRRLTASRGPYMGTSGKILSVSDAVVLGARGPMLDTGRAVAVASWRDGGYDFGYTGVISNGVVTTTAANSTALKAWIKETPRRDPTNALR